MTRTFTVFLVLAFGVTAITAAAAGSSGIGSSSSGSDRLPPDEELHRAMTGNPLGPGGAEFRRPALQPLYRQNLRARPDQAHGYITPFQRIHDGKWFGPLDVGSTKFQSSTYPPHIPILQPTWTQAHGLYPDNFERFKQGRTLLPGDWIFRPDPSVLEGIEHMVARESVLRGRVRGEVKGGTRIWQGQPAWPPVNFHPDGSGSVWMEVHNINYYRGRVLHEVEMHGNDKKTLYHLKVPAHPEPRHILMTQVKAAGYTDLDRRSQNSEFYLLHEALTGPHGQPVYALLGGTFLPRDAPELLREHMYSAFQQAH